jgi:hypothetical protein
VALEPRLATPNTVTARDICRLPFGLKAYESSPAGQWHIAEDLVRGILGKHLVDSIFGQF